MNFDLTQPAMAYMFGFIQSDGHLYGGDGSKGKFSVELNVQDTHILETFQSLIPYNSSIRQRIRDTNFKNDTTTSILTICDLEFRSIVEMLGIPYGKKGAVITIPTVDFSEVDYFRGLVDANGSLGLTANNYPFLSLTTDSDHLAHNFVKLIEHVTGKVKICNRNKRDNVYNLCVYKEDAQKVCEYLYYTDCICLNRKRAKVEEVQSWKRPAEMKQVSRNNWTAEEDDFVLSHSIEESCLRLKRSNKSVKMRVFRLKSKEVA